MSTVNVQQTQNCKYTFRNFMVNLDIKGDTAFLFFFFFLPHRVACGILEFPNQAWNPGLLQWKQGVLTTGPPGKSQDTAYFHNLVSIPLSSITCHYLTSD